MHATAPQLDTPALLRYGFPDLQTAADPAAGADFSQAINGRYFARLVVVAATLATDANVADRELVLQYETQEGAVYCAAGAPVTVGASSTATYTFSAYQPEAVWPIDGGVLVPLSPVILRPTDAFTLHVVAAEAGDQLSDIRWVWERFYSDSPVPG